MSGRQKLQAFAARVEEHGGDQWVFDFIAEGHSMKRVAELTGCSSRGLLYQWIKLGGDERRKGVEDARKLSAHSIAEDAGEILDDLAESATPISSADVSLATSRAKYRQWLAGMRNREEYGEKAGVEVNLTIGDLHLAALRRNSAAAIAAKTAVVEEAEAIVDVEYEIEDDQPVAAIEQSTGLADELMGLL